MGQHGPRVRHHPLDGVALRPALHALPSGSVFNRATELERMERSAIDQHTRDVSDDYLLKWLSSTDTLLQIHR